MARKQTTNKASAKKTTTRRKTTTSGRKTTKSTKKMTLVNPADLEHKVREKAYELYVERGAWHGNDWEDWLKAEKEIKKEFSLA